MSDMHIWMQEDEARRDDEAARNAEREFRSCLPSLGERCGNCHRCTEPDATVSDPAPLTDAD